MSASKEKDIVKLVRTSDDQPVGWYIKLQSDGETHYFRLTLNGPFDIPTRLTGQDKDTALASGAEFYISGRVPMANAMRYITMADIPDLEKRVSREVLTGNLNGEMQHILRNIEKRRKTLAELQAQLDRDNTAVGDIESLIRTVNSRNPVFYYAYGVHPGQVGDKEYCWRIPERLVNGVHPGSLCVVNTQYGLSEMRCTRVESTSEYVPHATVYGIQTESDSNREEVNS